MERDVLQVRDLSDPELIAEVKRRAGRERGATVALIASLMELDARRLYLGEGCSSLFTYCTQILHLSEHAAYARIEAARVARRFPVILEMLAGGSLTLTSVGLLAPLLTPENHHGLLVAAQHQSKRQVEARIAALRPQPPVPSTIRKLPAAPLAVSLAAPLAVPLAATIANVEGESPTPTAPVAAMFAATIPASRRPAVTPLSAASYKIQFTVSQTTHDKLRRAQDLLRHQNPNGDPAVIFDKAVTLLIEHLERRKHAPTQRPRPARAVASASRHIPASVRRHVWQRDQGRCAFVGTAGRCRETGFLEFHHVAPFAAGGASRVDNIELRCRAHNVFEAERDFGERPLVRGNWVRT